MIDACQIIMVYYPPINALSQQGGRKEGGEKNCVPAAVGARTRNLPLARRESSTARHGGCLD